MSNKSELNRLDNFVSANDFEAIFTEDKDGYLRQISKPISTMATVAICLLGTSPAVGTGDTAIIKQKNNEPAMTTTARLSCFSDPPKVKEELKMEVNASELIAEIRIWLSLNISQLAQVLKVGRPTIYAWINEESEIRGANFTRLSAIHSLAMHWKELAGIKLGKLVYSLSSEDERLLDRMTETEINLLECRNLMAELQTMIPTAREQRPASISEILKSKGFPQPSLLEQEISSLHNSNLIK